MSRTHTTAAEKPLSLWGLLFGLPVLASLAMLSTGQGDGGQGDAGGGEAGPPATGAGSANSGSSTPPPTGLTQEQWNAAWARERAKEATAAEARMLKTLGYESIEDAQAAAEARRVEAEKNLSDAQKATKRAEEAEAKAREREATAAVTERRSLVTLALAAAAVRTDRITQAATLLMAELPADADSAAITAAVKAQTTAMPEFYGTAGGNGVDLGGRGPNGSKGGKSSYQLGQEQGAAARSATAGQHDSFLAGLPGWTGK